MAKNSVDQADNEKKTIQKLPSMATILRHLYIKLAPEGSRRREETYQLVRQLANKFRLSEINYRAWIKKHDQLVESDRQIILKQIDQMPVKPIISILMPVYNPKINHLNAAIQSVRDQVYPYWELCLADDASTITALRDCLLRHCCEDPRIRVVFREENGHISAASNSALALAQGDYMALLDHDDTLHPMALFNVAQVINQHPDCEVIYSDEDKLNPAGKRVEPYYKPDFDPDLLRSQNMISHLGVYKTARVRELGGFRLGLEGSQDYDLLLRVLAAIKPHQVHHIPKVLYHWRITQQSVATRADVKPYALEAGKRALKDHLAHRGVQAEVETVRNFGYRVHYRLPDRLPSVHLLLCAKKLTERLVKSLQALMESTTYQPLKIDLCLEEKAPSQNTLLRLKKIKGRRVHLNPGLDVFNSGIVLNQLIEKSDAELIGLIDEGCLEFSSAWFVELVSFVVQEDIAAVGPKLLYKNGPIYSCGLVLGDKGIAQHQFNGMANEESNAYFGWASLTKGYSALPLECVLIKRHAYNQVGGFVSAIEDPAAKMIDLCLRFKELGLRNVVVPDVAVKLDIKYVSKQDIGGEDVVQNKADRAHLLRHWARWIEHDPAFNPNLTLYKGKPIVKPPSSRL
jgi:glycosyltransferase involved in cell wall biosynthesis